MREEYDFNNARKKPFAKKKKQITINVDESTIEYFKALAVQNGIPYQVLINLYLTDCAEKRKDLELSWN